MHRAAIPTLIVAVAIAGCSSSGNGVSTSSILGSAPTPPAVEAAAALPAASTPTSRAFQAGSVSARAKKCGYNFDEARLRSSFLAHEVSVGTTPDQMAQIEKVYDVAHNGIAKAAAGEANYCSDQKTRIIKADLNRLLAGDFEPPPQPVAKKQEDDDGGFFGGLFSGGSQQEDNFGSGDWWQKQQEKAGG
ncbi:hypothetical protein [Hyphomicrobium sp. LHD-15]|uniref:hypothetical protein n=1 Tax=Hyphomicrobium sp. LHD-15 TaxID=3072142 RepID=UPI00280DA833|nr:hypothetical protein [Hyphomicrobium sp. LHD-15]MDQ8697191.1 hypothetical protein [Hyphomicrobium sp. LHD-15]